MDEFTKIAVGCAIIFALAFIGLMVFAATHSVTSTTATPVGNFIIQNTVKYGNSTTYMLQWNGSAEPIQVYSGNTLTYSSSVVNGTQISVVLADGQPATFYANYGSVLRLTP
jgi:hypothetical protein